jgi:uncharacterized protein (TIGR03083 family)
MDRTTVWDHVVAERLALAAILRDLSEEEWAHPSLCAGWTVKDVAAHVISGPQLRWRETLKVLPGLVHGYNGMILRDAQRRGRASAAEILAEFDRWAGVRRGPVTVTHVEPLIDILVHTQDIVRPLGRRHAMPPDAAAVAADRSRLLAPLVGSARVVRGLRMVATDTDWARGSGPTVEGPMEELLMLCAGRAPDAGRLTGDGVAGVPVAG